MSANFENKKVVVSEIEELAKNAKSIKNLKGKR